MDVKPKVEKMSIPNQSTIGVIFPQILPLLQQVDKQIVFQRFMKLNPHFWLKVSKKWILDADVLEDLCNLLKSTTSALSEAIMPYTQVRHLLFGCALYNDKNIVFFALAQT